MVDHLIFLMDRTQVAWASKNLKPDSHTIFVAVTAEAMEYLQALHLPFQPVSNFADILPVNNEMEKYNVESYHLAREIEEYIYHNMPSVRVPGPGILTGHSYYIQYSIGAIARRAWLLLQTIKACRPRRVTIPSEALYYWFKFDGYERNPWFDLVEEWGQEYGFDFESPNISDFHLPNNSTSIEIGSRGKILLNYVKKVFRYKHKLLLRNYETLPLELGGLRLLVVGQYWYDWRPVVNSILRTEGAGCFEISRVNNPNISYWEARFSPVISDLNDKVRNDSGIKFNVDNDEEAILSKLFDDWANQNLSDSRLNVLGMNITRLLIPQLRSMVKKSPSLLRYVDEVATYALNASNPHAVCFFAIPNLAYKRLAFQCQLRDIPSVTYQHGFGYGVQIMAKDEQTEIAHGDYFLTYGRGIQPRKTPAFPRRARFVSIGSARISQMISREKPRNKPAGNKINILWLSEESASNAIGFETEDTKRFELEKKFLSILEQSNKLRIVYRPYPYAVAWDGTTSWYKRNKLKNIKLNIEDSVDWLVAKSDLVIVLTSSPTVWGEVFGMRKPLILFCNPELNPLTEKFQDDLANSCIWCRSSDEFEKELINLVSNGVEVISNLTKIDTSRFVADYVLDEGDPVLKAASFLNDVCRHRKSIEDWNRNWRRISPGVQSIV